VPSGNVGRALRWLTGPWTSANGMSWFRLFLIIVFVRWGVLAVYMIPSTSMEPTLHGDPRPLFGDRVAVNKLAFGPRVPFTKKRLLHLGEPKRWDIVVFDAVSPSSSEEYVIKRVVGLPGERIEIRVGGLFVNGRLLETPEGLVGATEWHRGLKFPDAVIHDLLLDFANRREIPQRLANSKDERVKTLRADLNALYPAVKNAPFWEFSKEEKGDLLSGVHPDSIDLVREWWMERMRIVGRPKYGVLKRPRYAVVPEGHYFCLGDNGYESIDSRYFGWIPQENLVGRAFAIVYPPKRVGPLWGFSSSLPGRTLFYGIPIALVLWEIVPGFIAFSWRVRGPIAHLGLSEGDHVLVNRIAFGLRIPFSTRRLWWWRAPRPGQILCYSLARGRGQGLDLYFGELHETEQASKGKCVVRGPEGDGPEWIELDRRAIVGSAVAVWWPAARRRIVRVA